MAGEEKTEKATPKKRRDAREKEGSVLQSNEIVTAISILGSFIVLSILGKLMYSRLCETLREGINAVGEEFVNDINTYNNITLSVIEVCILTFIPLALIIGFIVILTVMVQTRGLFSMKHMGFKFSRMNPLSGIKKLFSLQAVVGILKGLIELTAVVLVTYNQIESRMTEILSLTDTEPIFAFAYAADAIFSIVMILCIIFVFVAAADYLFQWWQFEKNLRMSKQEIKDEYKQMEGDPQIKGKIKQKQREMAQRRMMDEVPNADVVVRNPTHYAVALKYDISVSATAAPVVIAKGQDALALKIVEIAEKNDVYVTENRPLARELYDRVPIGAEIPQSLFSAVAIIISEMYNAKGKTFEAPEEATRKRR